MKVERKGMEAFRSQGMKVNFLNGILLLEG